MKPIPPRSKTAFSRTDLLALVVTSSVLGGLFLKADSKMSIQSEVTQCLNHMRQLARAWMTYAGDHEDYLPGNVDIGSAHGQVWVAGNVPTMTNVAVLLDPAYSQLGPYTRDPDLYRCPSDRSTFTWDGVTYHQLRSVAMNHAVGTKLDGISPTDGPWLDGNHSHTANRPWRTFAKLSELVVLQPSEHFVFIDEDEFSINDGTLALSMHDRLEWLDWPGTRHNSAAAMSFAAGNAALHRWVDERTRVRDGNVRRSLQPGNPDILWLQSRTTIRVKPE